MCIDLILEETLIHLDEINNSLEGSFFVMGFEAYKPIYFSNKFFKRLKTTFFNRIFTKIQIFSGIMLKKLVKISKNNIHTKCSKNR